MLLVLSDINAIMLESGFQKCAFFMATNNDNIRKAFSMRTRLMRLSSGNEVACLCGCSAFISVEGDGDRSCKPIHRACIFTNDLQD